MATIFPTIVDVSPLGDGSALQVVWTPVTSAGADVCAAVKYPKHSDKSVQVAGTFGGGSIAVNGSNDGTNYAPLNDPTGTVIAITAEKIKAVLENTVLVQPAISGGTGQSVTISMLLQYANPART